MLQDRLHSTSRLEFFLRTGFCVVPNFLSDEMCATLISEVASTEWNTATVVDGERIRARKHSVGDCRTKHHIIGEASAQELHSRFLAIRPKLESHFGMALRGCQAPVFLSYSVGDFYTPHTDTGDGPDLEEAIKERKLSAVLFLNASAEKGRDTYSGGALVFYGLFPDDPQLKLKGFPLQPEKGLLIAFSSRMVHQVLPVMRGERYSVVTWYF